jgi:hypothetical protein
VLAGYGLTSAQQMSLKRFVSIIEGDLPHAHKHVCMHVMPVYMYEAPVSALEAVAPKLLASSDLSYVSIDV